jgi:K+-sensing histidine kinase KdpD
VVGQDGARATVTRPWPSRTTPRVPGVVLAVAVVGPALAAWVLSAVIDTIRPANGALALVVIVVAVATTGHRVAGVAAALSSALSFVYLLTEPVNHLAIASADDVATAVLLAVVGVAVTEIVLWGRRRQAEAARRLGHLEGLLSTSRLLAESDQDPRVSLGVVGRQIADVLGGPACRYEAGAAPATAVTITREGRLIGDGVEHDVARAGLPVIHPVVIPVGCGDQVIGRYVIETTTVVLRPDPEQLRVAVALADQAGAALAHRR